jgi:catechol 2,3-dioxygenase-like lactoylglutathione lyase family enzyme
MPSSAGLLHHVEVYVSDLKRSSEFWGWFLGLLGYAKIAEWDQGVSYKLGDTYLVLVQTEPQHLGTPYHRCRTGLNHLAFHASSRRHVDEMTEKLKRRGTRILYSDRHPFAGGEGYYAVFFEDPDRIKVELVAPSEDTSGGAY